MKTILSGVLLTLSTLAYANKITLTHRSEVGCSNDSCSFDFFNMTQEYGFGLRLLYGNGSGDMLGAVQVVSEIGMIADLGKKSCKDIENIYENRGSGYPTTADRQNDPMFWLVYSNAWDELQNSKGKRRIEAKQGHCYLMYKSSRDQQVIVAFHVKK